MYCAACNLNYADQLNFCRRCGQPLGRSASEPVMDTVCCTRCGARTVRGEKFCQHCGARVVAPTPETVIGACYHCGTSWRTGWLFCKTCGLDRDRALLLPTSMPVTPSAAQMAVPEAEQMPEIVKVFCKRCGASAKPFSRYCETCGNTLDLSKEASPKEPASEEVEKTVITGKLVVPPAAAAFRTQSDSPTGRLQASLSDRGQRPAPIESVSEFAKESAKLAEPADTAEIARAARKTAAVHDSLTTNFPEATDPLVGGSTNPDAELVFTSLPDREDDIPIGSEQSIQQSDSRGATVVWIIIVALAVAAGFVAWRLWASQKNLAISPNSPPRPSPSQATAQTSTALLGATPETAVSPTPAVGAPTPAGMVFVPGGTFKMGRDDG